MPTPYAILMKTQLLSPTSESRQGLLCTVLPIEFLPEVCSPEAMGNGERMAVPSLPGASPVLNSVSDPSLY